MEEKRRYMRFNVLMDAIAKTAGGALKKMKVNNFSREGLGIISDNAIPDGESVEIELKIPGDNIPVVVTGEIAWSATALSSNEFFRGGIQLKKIKSADRGRILNFIYNKWMSPKT